MENKLKLEEGKTYVLRNGTVPKQANGALCVLRKYQDPLYKWEYAGDCYREDGRYWQRETTPFDIVAEYVPPSQEKPEATTETKTLRDQFAMAAIQGLLACPHGEGNLAIDAYYWADKMLVERAKGKAQS